MNGFEPIQRRIIDYTLAGQWSEVYNGPRDECEEAKLKTENKQLRELIDKMFLCIEVVDDCACARIYDRMRELGIEVE